MDTAARNSPFLDADAFLRTDQSEFGTAWRYELVRGAIVAHAAPSPEHGVILGNLAGERHSRLRSHPECRSEVGSGAAPQYEQRDTARIPDAMIRCGQTSSRVVRGGLPVGAAAQAAVGPEASGPASRRGRAGDCRDLPGRDAGARLSAAGAGWVFELIAGPDAQVALPSVGITVPLAALYERVALEGE